MSLIISSSTGRNSPGLTMQLHAFLAKKRTDYSLRQHELLYLFQAAIVKGADEFRNEETAKNRGECRVSNPIILSKKRQKT